MRHTADSQFSGTTLVDLLRWRALHEPNTRGYTFLADGEQEESCLTFNELDRRARAISALIHSIGENRQPLLLVFPSGLEFIAAFFGCLYAGSIVVAAYPPRPNRSLERFGVIAHDSGARVVVTLEAIRSRIESSVAELKGLENLKWITIDNVSEDTSEDWMPPDTDGQSLALLQYTSGSTARPNGTMVSHGNILHNSRIVSDVCQHTKKSVGVGWLPMTHDMGLIGNMIQPIFVGCHYILMAPEHFLVKPIRWLRAITRYRATTSGGPNFAYDFCYQKIKPELRSELDLSSWDLAFNGAEPVRPETIDRFSAEFSQCGFRREVFYPCYGLAESTLIVTGGSKLVPPVERVFNADELGAKRAVIEFKNVAKGRVLIGCGRTWLDQQIIIVDPETCRCCSNGHIGEIWISGPSVTQGYWKQPRETERVFQGYLRDTGEGPYLRSGDLGFLLDGELFISGRLKDLIIIGGTNHFPVDIEMTVEKCHRAVVVK